MADDGDTDVGEGKGENETQDEEVKQAEDPPIKGSREELEKEDEVAAYISKTIEKNKEEVSSEEDWGDFPDPLCRPAEEVLHEERKFTADAMETGR